MNFLKLKQLYIIVKRLFEKPPLSSEINSLDKILSNKGQYFSFTKTARMLRLYTHDIYDLIMALEKFDTAIRGNSVMSFNRPGIKQVTANYYFRFNNRLISQEEFERILIIFKKSLQNYQTLVLNLGEPDPHSVIQLNLKLIQPILLDINQIINQIETRK